MKICFLADASHSNLLHWVRYFNDKLYHDIHVISFNRPIYDTTSFVLHHIDYGDSNLNNMGDYHIRNLLKYDFFKTKMKYFLAVPRIKRILTEIKPDLLIGYRLISYGLSAALSNFHPVVIVAQSQQIIHPPESKILYLIARYVIKKADLLQTWAPHSQKKLAEFGGDENRIICFPKGVDTDLFRANKRIRKAFTIISTRSIRPEYGIGNIIKAMKNLKNKIDNLKYIILGDGIERPKLEKMAKDLDLKDNVKFLGYRHMKEVPIFLQQSDIYISTSPFDCVSSSLLEAMACGVFPIVTYNEANANWIENGVNGFLVPHNNPKKIAERILESYKNVELREKAQMINLELIQKFGSMDQNMRKMEKIYLKLVKSSSSPRKED